MISEEALPRVGSEENARLREALTIVGDAIDASMNDIGLGTSDRLERASTRLAAAWDKAHALAFPEGA